MHAAMPAPMTREERDAFLAGIHTGVVTVDEPGRGPLSVPVWYLYEPGGDVVLVTRPEARKALLSTADALRTRRDQLDQVLTAESAWRERCEEQRHSESTGIAALGDAIELMAETHTGQAEARARFTATLRWCLLGAAALVGFCGFAGRSRRSRLTP